MYRTFENYCVALQLFSNEDKVIGIKLPWDISVLENFEVKRLQNLRREIFFSGFVEVVNDLKKKNQRNH